MMLLKPLCNSSSKRPPSAAGTGAEASNAGSVSVESFPCVVDDRYYLRRMKEILQDGLPKPSPPARPDRLSGHVFIGNQRNADDTTGLRSDGIDHVLSCAASRRSTDSPYDGDSGIIDYFLIPAEDREDFDITRYFDAAFLFLDRVKRRRGKVLVHCNMGVNRSGAVVAAYLMVDEKRNLLDVVSYLKGKRKLVLSNKGFRRQLVQFARSRGLLDPVIDTVTRISYMDDSKKGSYEADEDDQRRLAKREEGRKMADGEAADGKNSLRKLMRDLEEELRNGNGDVDKWSKRENENAKRNRNEKKLETVNDELVQNGDDSSPRHLAIADKSGGTVSTRLVTNAEPLRKFSSSVQYWPAVADPVRASTPNTSNDNIIANGELPDEKTAVTKKRRSLRTRKDVDKSNQEPQKTTTSTVFCTLRAKPKRNIEVRKRSDLADNVNKLEINDTQLIKRFNDFPAVDFPSSSTTFAQEEMLSSTVSLRARCLSSTAVDRPSSIGADTEINGFLVLLGKKIVHAKSSSQWNLTTQDREPAANFLTSETRLSRVITRSRTNLNYVPLSVSSFGGPSWQSVEKISSTARNTNVFVVRKDKKETFFANN